MSDAIDYGPILADLERRRSELEQAIATIRSLASPGSETTPTMAPQLAIVSGGNGVASIGPHQFFGMTAPDAVRAYLMAVKRPRTAAQIATDLVAHGWSTTSNSPANTIRTTLVRLQEADVVVQVKGKEWGLVTWFPGLNKGKRPVPEERARSRTAPTEPRSEYHAFITERMSQGASMKDAAAAWRAKKQG